MPICSKCNIEKDSNQFWINRSKNRLQTYCKECSSKRRTNYYKQNKEQEEKKKKERYERNREWLTSYKKKHSCSNCNEKRWYVLEFHHKTDDKEYNVSEMMKLSLKTIEKEITKCIVICANCHRELHFLEH